MKINLWKSILVLVFFIMGCSFSSVQLQKDDSNSSATRTFDNSLENDSPRKAELNLEKTITKVKEPQFNFIFSLTYVPLVNDPLTLVAGDSLILSVDGEKVIFPTKTGSKEDVVGPALGLGKRETVRFQNIGHDILRKISKSSDVRFEVQGQKGRSSGRLTSENIEKLGKFIQKNL